MPDIDAMFEDFCASAADHFHAFDAQAILEEKRAEEEYLRRRDSYYSCAEYGELPF